MRAIEFERFGSPSVLSLVRRPDPVVSEKTAIVRVEAASINPSDVKNVEGRMHQTTLPRIPGRDYAGVVVDGPKDWVGAQVWGTGGDVGFTRDGTHTELLSVPRASLVRKPDGLSFEEAACIGVTFVTAWCALNFAQLADGETIAVLGSSGGVGSAAVQIAKRMGVRVIGVNRSKPSADSPATGLTDVFLESTDPELPEKLREANKGLGADVVFNTAGGPMFEIGLGLLAHCGRQVEITSPTERRASLDVVDFYHNESRLFGLDTLKRDLTACGQILTELKQGFDDGSYKPPSIASILPLSNAQEAYERVGRGERNRIVLKPGLD